MRRRSEPHSGSPGLFFHARVPVDFQREVPASVSCCLWRNPQCSSCSCPRSLLHWASCQVLPPQSAYQIYGSIGRGHRGVICQLQYEHHSSVFPSWWAVVSAQDRVNETSGDCFYRTHETTQWDIRVLLMESTKTRLWCEMSCFHCDFNYGLILGYDALFIDKQLPEVSEKLAALDS